MATKLERLNKKHKKNTGVSNEIILKNLKKLSEKGKKIAVRIPIIPGINDTFDNINQTAEFLAPLEGIEYISLLPYHKIGKQKYQRLNTPYSMRNMHSPPEKKIKEIKDQFKKKGLKIKTGE